MSSQRSEEEGELRELLEKDKKREMERVEREMQGPLGRGAGQSLRQLGERLQENSHPTTKWNIKIG